MTQKLTVSALVRNRSGVLLRVAGLFARRGYNIRSLTVSETEHPEFSRMTVVSEVEPEQVKQVEAQLLKLEDVIKVAHLEEGKLVSSELLLIKVHCLNKDRPQVLKTVIAYGARGQGHRSHDAHGGADGRAGANRRVYRGHERPRNSRAFALGHNRS